MGRRDRNYRWLVTRSAACVAETGKVVQTRVGISLGLLLGTLMNYFMAGPDVVRWDLLAVGRAGPYQLVVHHPHGAIVEYFTDVTAALVREGELEDLLIEACSASRISMDRRWTLVQLRVH
jgi:hypothetical protein